MFCLRSWLPLLFIPTNASPAFIFLFFVCTYFLNRPCVYCSLLLLILFFTSCNWSDRCFFDFSSDWFDPRPPTTAHDVVTSEHGNGSNATTIAGVGAEMAISAAGHIARAASDKAWGSGQEWTGLGAEWIRNLLGKREWTIDCLDVKIQL